MSTTFSARKICELALRKIGTYSINDEAADTEEVNVALDWLDMIMAQLSGTERCWWLMTSTISMPLTASTASYDVLDALSVDAPSDGIQFPYAATLNDGSDNTTVLDIIRRDEYEAIEDKTTSGTPTHIWIDRATEPTMKVYPVPGSDQTGYTIDLVVQTFAPSVSGGSSTVHGLRAAWQRWIVMQLAYDIGSGPVRTLPDQKLVQIQKQAEFAKKALMAFENQEHESQPRLINFRY